MHEAPASLPSPRRYLTSPSPRPTGTSSPFSVLSDVGSDTAQQYGLAFDLPDDLTAVYDRLGFDLQRVNGGYARTLPLPTTYVIDREGVIRWAFVDAGYTRRAEPTDVLAALDALG